MTDLRREPTRLASVAAFVCGLGALGTLIPGSGVPVALGAAGLAIFAWGIRRDRLFGLDLGPFVLFGGVLQAGVRTGSVELALAGTAFAVLTWDFGHTARDLGHQLGRDAETTRLEVVRILASVGTAIVTATLGYTIYLAGVGGGSNAALALLLLAVLFATMALGSSDRSTRAESTMREPAEG